MNKNKHLTLDDRYTIQHSLENRLSFKAIGTLLGKDCTTIAKEIKNHIIFEKKGAPYRTFNDCVHRRNCRINYHLCNPHATASAPAAPVVNASLFVKGMKKNNVGSYPNHLMSVTAVNRNRTVL